jgi:hypothetical protein
MVNCQAQDHAPLLTGLGMLKQSFCGICDRQVPDAFNLLLDFFSALRPRLCDP